MIRYAIIAGIISVGVIPALCFASPPSDLECYLVQMHIHSHTNHNGSELPASMEWHCAQARAHGFDVIWWSDHSEIFDTFNDLTVSFAPAFFEEEGGYVDLGRTRSRRRLSRLELDAPADGWRISTAGRSLEVEVVSSGGSEFERVRLTPASARGPVKMVSWCRPVTSGLRVEVALDVNGLGKDTFLRFGFDLAAHPDGCHHLVFDIGPADDAGPGVVGDTLVVRRMGVAGFPSKLDIDLEEAAGYLPDGYDNTLSSMFIEFGARNGAAISVALDSLTLVSDRPAGENQHRVLVELVKTYNCRYGLTQYVGVEAGGIHTPERPHMNAYFPDSTETFESLVVDPEVERADWAAGVHERGGLVSLNHPFGAALRPSVRGLEVDRETAAPRELARTAGPLGEDDLWAVAGPIIETGGLGCDILEVGYLFRGTGSLSDHLRLWDLVLAHGVRLVGNGVSDSHGGMWGPDLRPNPFASWLWAEGADRASLLYALEAGSLCFGDPFLFAGEFAFGVEDAFMGDTLYVGRGDRPSGWIHLEPWEEGFDIRLVQVKIEPGRQPAYIRRGGLEDARHGFEIPVEGACFARIEIYGPEGEPLVFSNPVWLIPE